MPGVVSVFKDHLGCSMENSLVCGSKRQIYDVDGWDSMIIVQDGKKWIASDMF